MLLNPKAKGFGNKNDRSSYNSMSSMYDYGQYGMIDEYPQMDDRAFVDYITSKNLVKADPFSSNNEVDSKKHRENNNFTNDYYNFGNMYPSYEPHGKSK